MSTTKGAARPPVQRPDISEADVATLGRWWWCSYQGDLDIVEVMWGRGRADHEPHARMQLPRWGWCRLPVGATWAPVAPLGES
ncbi:MAG: hypothetical protein ACI9K2_007192 [Myxococcota bacterium]|jgi:hypothetical protein